MPPGTGDKASKAMRATAIEKTDRQSWTRDIVTQWFRSRGWRPFEFQRNAWDAYLAGKSGLIHAATGIGKTYAAWFGALMEWMADSSQTSGMLPQNVSPQLSVLWVTPLRALAADLQAALLQVVEDLELPWSVECRTGDTAASVRNRQKKRLPTALVTTPESLNLLISYPVALETFKNLRLVVVDEWHELMGSKRGVMVEVALARLKSWTPRLKIWGLSATMGNTKTAMSVLLGAAAGSGCLIRGLTAKSLVVDSIVSRQMKWPVKRGGLHIESRFGGGFYASRPCPSNRQPKGNCEIDPACRQERESTARYQPRDLRTAPCVGVDGGCGRATLRRNRFH